jgi:GTPase SAR1 family protein
MYDITNTKSLTKLQKYCRKINEMNEQSPILDPIIILVGNKLDLEEYREVLKEDADKFKKFYNIQYSMEMPLKTGENVEEMFQTLTRMILKFVRILFNSDLA